MSKKAPKFRIVRNMAGSFLCERREAGLFGLLRGWRPVSCADATIEEARERLRYVRKWELEQIGVEVVESFAAPTYKRNA